VDFTQDPDLYYEVKRFAGDPTNNVDLSKFIRSAVRKELARRKRALMHRAILDNDMKAMR